MKNRKIQKWNEGTNACCFKYEKKLLQVQKVETTISDRWFYYLKEKWDRRYYEVVECKSKLTKYVEGKTIAKRKILKVNSMNNERYLMEDFNKHKTKVKWRIRKKKENVN